MDDVSQPISTQTLQAPLPANSSKTFLFIVGIIALIAFSTVGGYLLGSNKQPQSSQPLPTTTNSSSPTIPQPTPTPDISNWKTYIPEDKIFSFKYPPPAAVKTTKGTNYMLGDKFKLYEVTYLDVSPYNLIYSTNPDFKNLDIFDILKKNFASLIGVTNLSVEITTLNSIALPSPNNDAMLVVNYCYPEGCQKFTYFKRDSTIFRIDGDNQILSTFKFTP